MEPVNLAPAPAARATGPAKQYLSFSLGDEEYAVDILRVREIRGICPITPLPQSPAMVKGVMNLRGAVVPVMDLRVALGLPPAEYGKFSVIIVMALSERTIGFVVDSMSDVLSLEPSDIEGAPDVGGRVDVSQIGGIARTGERFVILLDIDRIAAFDLRLGS